MMRSLRILLASLAVALGGVFGTPAHAQSLFTSLAPAATGVTFSNTLTEGPKKNVLAYEYFYNGGGVAVGDLNGDDRPDLYFTANQKPNALYLNEGSFQFREVTRAADVADATGWKTG
ncbi:MAG: hypothetical protein ABEK84_03340, partial [Salinibacter sp.]